MARSTISSLEKEVKLLTKQIEQQAAIVRDLSELTASALGYAAATDSDMKPTIDDIRALHKK